MGHFYTVPGTLAAVGSGLKGVAAAQQGATFRTQPTITRVSLGYNGTPADNAMLGEIRRTTTAGTSTAVTPEPHNPSAPPSNLAGGENFTIEPTTGNIVFEIPQAQRTTYLEAFDLIEGPMIAASNSNGISLRTLHASYTGAASGKLEYYE